jgi:hypothetical protein
LRAKLDIALFTPGHAAGHPLAISVAPEGMAEILPTERDQAAKLSAAALASIYKEGRAHAIHAERSLIKTLQLSEAEILSLAQVSLTNY